MAAHPWSSASRSLLAAAGARGRGQPAATRRAVRALEALLGVEVAAVVLLGSHARRRAGAESDLDVLVVTRAVAREVRRAPAQGVDLDLRVVPLETLQREGVPPALCSGPLPVLFDPDGHARRALRVARALHAAGRAPLSKAALAERQAWVERMTRRTRAELRTDPALAAVRLARLRVRLLELWFEVRGEWPRADRDALERWRHTDPALTGILERLAGRQTLDEQLEAVQALARRVLRR